MRQVIPTVRALLAVFFFPGCVSAPHAVAVGPRLAPRPSDCEVRYERLTQTEANERYRQVGVMCIPENELRSSPEYWSFDEQIHFSREACALGGELFVAFQKCEIDRRAGYEYGIYVRSKPSQ